MSYRIHQYFSRSTARAFLFCFLFLSGLWLCAPRPVHAQPEGYPPEPVSPEFRYGYPRPPARTTTRPGTGLIIAGAVTLGMGWVLSVIPAGLCDLFDAHHGPPSCDTWPLYIPVVGPWLDIAVVSAKGPSLPGVYTVLLLDGLAQAAGLGMLIGGLVAHTRDPVSTRYGLRIAPLSLGGGGGISVSGRF